VNSYEEPNTGPAIVHCSAGVGRTGTFIALDSLLQQAKEEAQIDVFDCVRHMRYSRVNMVQTQVGEAAKVQLFVLYRFILIHTIIQILS